MTDPIKTLRQLVGEVADIRYTSALLDWDMQTMMPPGGVDDRSHQIATMQRLAHDKFTSSAMGEALEAARGAVGESDPDSDDARLVWKVGRDFDKETRVTSAWVSAFARATSLAQQAWQAAKPTSDFEAFKPHLAEVIKLRREYAGFFEPYDHIYDPLLDDYEPGMTTAQVTEIFADLRKQQVALVQAIADKPQPDDSVLHQHYPIDAQWAFGESVVKQFGYDFERGRQDESAHPFTTSFGLGDVRITTRFQEDFLSPALFATLHEAGHAIYEQGYPSAFARTPLADSASLGVHESQSRLWENLVGRSHPFWSHFYAELQNTFPDTLASVELDTFYRAVNKVEHSLIRVEADEATYNLHIMIRFELEQALLTGDLSVEDLPAAWNERTEEFLGITPPDHQHGVLQDIHWSIGYFGYFPTYALGNLIACQWWEKLHQDLPDLDAQIGAGDFTELLKWLRSNIHQHGAKFKPTELIERVTGEALNAQPYLRYLRHKYGQLYNLD
ncbi:MAG: carboxypeptidase M32 [Anaerolineales bacterium]|jgi:carboxypeptidase Taq